MELLSNSLFRAAVYDNAWPGFWVECMPVVSDEVGRQFGPGALHLTSDNLRDVRICRGQHYLPSKVNPL